MNVTPHGDIPAFVLASAPLRVKRDAHFVELSCGLFTLRIEGEATLQLRSSPALTVEPSDTLFDALAGISGHELTILADGSIKLTFEHGSVHVPTDARYESWQLHGPNRLLVVGAPAGQVAYWSKEQGGR